MLFGLSYLALRLRFGIDPIHLLTVGIVDLRSVVIHRNLYLELLLESLEELPSGEDDGALRVLVAVTGSEDLGLHSEPEEGAVKDDVGLASTTGGDLDSAL